MPFLDDDLSLTGFQPIGHPDKFKSTPDAPEPPANPAGFTDRRLWGAAFERENEIGALRATLEHRAQQFGDRDPDHNPWDRIGGTDLEPYADYFLTSRNDKETDYLIARLRRELENTKILDEAGWKGFLASGVASIASPSTLLSGPGLVTRGARGLRLVEETLRKGARVGAEAAGGAAIQEAALHQMQATRTLNESLLAVGGATVLGSLLGAGIAQYKGRSIARLGERMEADLRMPVDPALDPLGPGGMQAAERLRAERLADVTTRIEPETGSGMGTSAGAKAVEIAENKVAGTAGIGEALSATSPLTRVAYSSLGTARDALHRLVESPLALKQNEQGIPTGPRGGSVETVIKTQGEARLYRAVRAMDEAYAEYRFGDKGATAAPLRAGLKRMMGDRAALTFKEFKEEVGRAMRAGDVHDNKFVAQAAKAMRKELFDPLKAMAQKHGLLPEDAMLPENYLTRVYDVDTILKQYPRFINTLVDYLKRGQAGAEREAAEIEAKIAELEQKAQKPKGGDDGDDGPGGGGDGPQPDLPLAPKSPDVVREEFVARTEDRIEDYRDKIDDINIALKAAEGEEKAALLKELDEAKARVKDTEEELAKSVAARTDADDVPVYRDPESGDEMSQSEVEDIISMWRIVQDEKRPPRPQGLQSWIMSAGRLQDQGGEITSILGGKNRQLISAKGMTLDDAALKAYEAGFFAERPSINEFLDALSRDINVEPVIRLGDDALLEDWRAFRDMEEQLDRLGIAGLKNEAAIHNHFRRSELVGAGARDRGPLGSSTKSTDGDPFFKLAQLDAAIDDAIAEMRGILPEGVGVRVFDDPDELGPRLAAAVRNAPGRVDAFFDPQTAAVYLARHAVDPAGRLTHEAVHALRSLKLLTDKEVELLAKTAAEKGDVFPQKLQATYREAYANRSDPAKAIEEEAAAHLVEARKNGTDFGREINGILDRVLQFFERLRNKLSGYGFQTADDVIEAVLSGEMAKRRAVQQVMAQEDVTAFAVKPALDMSPEARKARAEAMGFDTSKVLYHGTSQNFTAFDKKQFGSSTKASGASQAAWLVDDPRTAAGYAEYASQKPVRDMLAKADTFERLAQKEGGNSKWWDKQDEAVGRADELEREGGVGQSVYPLYVRGRLLERDFGGAEYTDVAREISQLLREAKTGGYDGVKLTNLADDVALNNRPATHYAIFDPSNIRSVNADFDPSQSGSSNIMFAVQQDIETGRSMRRDLDSLGYYSKALEAARNLSQAKGTPEQMLAQLKKAGVKDAEIEMTGLKSVLSDSKSVTRDQIIKHLEENRVGLKEVTKGGEISRDLLDEYAMDEYGRPFDELSQNDRDALLSDVYHPEDGDGRRGVKWQQYSLDPSNPTYRETVIHLPKTEPTFEEWWKGPIGSQRPDEATAREAFRRIGERGQIRHPNDFHTGHFPEPNIIGHMMTSMTRHEGRPVFTIDQIQSDWGQKLRDGGVRDEAKIADLKQRIKAQENRWVSDKELQQLDAEATRLVKEVYPNGHNGGRKFANQWDAIQELAKDGHVPTEAQRELASELRLKRRSLNEMYEPTVNMLRAELRTAEAATPGNPLVNTTDQWTTTTLRRAIRQAAEADADYIAVPHGDTVLSYNPGDENGMRQFYGSRGVEGIVPKNLRKILEKIDKDAAKPMPVDALETPSKGMAGNGFTLFPLTETVKRSVIEDGQPMFAMRAEPAPDLPPALQPVANEIRRGMAQLPRAVRNAIARSELDQAQAFETLATTALRTTARKGTVHAEDMADIKALGLVTDDEWRAMSKRAEKLRPIYRTDAAHQARFEAKFGPDATEQVEEALTREAMAQMMREGRAGASFSPDIDGAMTRTWGLLDQVGYRLRQSGIRTDEQLASTLRPAPQAAAPTPQIDPAAATGELQGILAPYLDALRNLAPERGLPDFSMVMDEAGRVVGATDTAPNIKFTRDADGMLSGVEYQGRAYSIDRDAMGNIRGLLTAAQKAVADQEAEVRVAASRALEGLGLPGAQARAVVDQAIDVLKASPDMVEQLQDVVARALSGDGPRFALADAEKGGAEKPKKPKTPKQEINELRAKLVELRKFADMSDYELKQIAQDAASKITRSPAGRVIDPHSPLTGRDPMRQLGGPLQERTLKIPDEEIMDFLDHDVERLARYYTRSVAPDVALMREFGDLELSETKMKIQDEANALKRRVLQDAKMSEAEFTRLGETATEARKLMRTGRSAEVTPDMKAAIEKIEGLEAEHLAIQKMADRDMRDLQAMSDRLRHAYALPEDASGRIPRLARMVKSINYLRLMGGMTISAIPDLARHVMVNGIGNNLDGMVQALANFKAVRKSMEEVKLAGTAADMVLDSRALGIADMMDNFGAHSKFERGIEALQGNYGIVSLMAPWNAAAKQWAGFIVQTNILRAARDVSDGKALSKGMTTRMAKSGLDPEIMQRIWTQFMQHGEIEGKVMIANTDAWTDDIARNSYRAAIVGDVDRIIVSPGQEKPLWMSTQTGSIIGQFKSFGLVSVQRVTLAAIQQRDAGVYVGAMMAVALGVAVEYLKALAFDKELPKSTEQLIYAGVGNSGLTGWLYDADHLMYRASRGTIGVQRLVGAKEPISRYKSQNVSSALAGPSAGALQDILQAFGGAASGDIRQSDLRAMRRLIPYQNLFYLGKIIRNVEDQIIEQFDLPKMKPRVGGALG